MYFLILKSGSYATGDFKPLDSVEVPQRPHDDYSWNGQKWIAPAGKAISLLREERNNLLSATDWQASSDLTMTAEQTAYRKALRDLPSTATPSLNSDGQLTGVTWPTKPE